MTVDMHCNILSVFFLQDHVALSIFVSLHFNIIFMDRYMLSNFFYLSFCLFSVFFKLTLLPGGRSTARKTDTTNIVNIWVFVYPYKESLGSLQGYSVCVGQMTAVPIADDFSCAAAKFPSPSLLVSGFSS